METERASNDTLLEPIEVNQTKVSCDLDSSQMFSENKVEFKHLGESEMKVARPLRLLTMAVKKTPKKNGEIWGIARRRWEGVDHTPRAAT